MKHHLHHLALKQKPLLTLVTGVAIAEPVMTAPQLLKIWSNQDASDLSLISWLFYLLSAVVWLMYGLKNREKPVTLSAAMWLVFYVPIVAAIILYG